jgi:predicted tellurium resistance membrane protein TerC
MDYSKMLNGLLSAEGMVTLFTLTLLEIVLGIDNIIFISITADKLPRHQKAQARTIGLILALIIRILLLFSITWIVGLKAPLFHLGSFWGVTGRDLILLAGGIFLIYKTCGEIWEKVNGEENEHGPNLKKVSLNAIILQIVLIDIVFSFDSILTAVAISSNLFIMSGAVIISMIIMILFSGIVSEFINQNPRIKTLALAFLLIIGFVLIAEACKEPLGIEEVPKSYIYVALGFSLFVESLNLWEKKRKRKKAKEREVLKDK